MRLFCSPCIDFRAGTTLSFQLSPALKVLVLTLPVAAGAGHLRNKPE
jgi:hypothetical protein